MHPKVSRYRQVFAPQKKHMSPSPCPGFKLSTRLGPRADPAAVARWDAQDDVDQYGQLRALRELLYRGACAARVRALRAC